jgi:O-antigen/teichoic acid export membrane protein
MTNHPTSSVLTVKSDFLLQSSSDIKTIAYSGGALLIASAVGNGLNYAFGIFLARLLGADDFGLYALALTVFNIVTLIVVFGLDTAAIKFVSHHLQENQESRAATTIGTSTILAFGSAFVAACALAIAAQPLAMTVYGKRELSLPLALFAAAIPFATVSTVLISALQAFQTIRHTIFIKYCWEPIAKFVFAAALLWAGFYLAGVVVAIILTFAISTALAIRAMMRLLHWRPDEVPVWDVGLARELIAYCMPLAIAKLFSVLATRSDILLLGYWMRSEDVGIYLAAFQTAAMMALVLGAFDTGLAPILSRAWSQRDSLRMTTSYQAVSRLAAMVSAPLFCCLVLISQAILGVFGQEFRVGSAALVILAVGQFVNNITGAANTVLLMSGQSQIVMRNTVVMGVGLLMAATLLIPRWGMTGAAVAASGTLILTNIIRVFQVWQLHQVQPFTWGLAKPVVAALVATGILMFLQSSLLSIPTLVLAIALGALYLVGLLALGVNWEDRLVLRSIISRGRGRAGES